MFQVRFHGRGGQGVVTAAELLSVAAFDSGAHAQAFPSFGSERMGAPIAAFCRIDDHPIRTREPVAKPDAVIVQDATLLSQPDVLAGLSDDGCLLINSNRPAAALDLGTGSQRVCTVPATELALQHLGRPVPNVALLGGFAALTGRISLDALTHAITERFGAKLAAGNIAAATAAYEHVRTAGAGTATSGHLDEELTRA